MREDRNERAGLLPDGTLAGTDAEAQARQIFANIEALLAAHGARPEHLVKLLTFVAGTEHLAGYRAARQRPSRTGSRRVTSRPNPWWSWRHWPARTTQPKWRRSPLCQWPRAMACGLFRFGPAGFLCGFTLSSVTSEACASQFDLWSDVPRYPV
ncbi:RidA family protein [Amycolatopsis sp. NPDC001319]|uniref:RidA family protein n=1 Tax=unclassified Amycolatopsis TaxID=2618356 RepID=UPI0036AE6246